MGGAALRRRHTPAPESGLPRPEAQLAGESLDPCTTLGHNAERHAGSIRVHHAGTGTTAGFGAGREISRIISAAATQSMPATKNAGR